MKKRGTLADLDSEREKRTKADTDVTMAETRPALIRQPSLLQAQAHTGSPAVTLRPRLMMDGNRIDRVIISRLQRTPSPFTGRMGDHTVAWQAVVDSVHALLHGMTLDEAVTALRGRQDAAAAWMGRRGSDERKLLTLLEDAVDRRPLLENAAYQASTFLNGAAAARTDADKQSQLEQAIAWHLTYVNYLPFATVPAKSSRGSRGSGEGTRRMALLGIEQAGPPKPAEARAASADDIVDTLWRMFAFDAALREANAEMALKPATVVQTSDTQKALSYLAAQCVAHIDAVLIRGPKTKARSPKRWDGMAAPVAPALTLIQISAMAKPYADKDEEYGELSKLAQRIRDAAGKLDRLDGGQQFIKTLDELYDYRDSISSASVLAAQLNADVTEQSKTAVPDAALILAHLLHDHQVTVARAYPRSVIISEFLRPSHLEAAITRLREVIAQDIASPDGKKMKELEEAVEKNIAGLGQPAIATVNGWAAGAASEELVVSYSPGQNLSVNGRAPAPAGVAGMGAHTTAWVVECMATAALVIDAMKAGADPVQAFKDEVKRDLVEGPITLDCLLPTGQLAGGQLESILDAALAVLSATQVADAATSYLVFRNVLPYATVDGGERIGHGEREDATKEETLDGDALREAAETQAEMLIDDTRRASSSAVLVRIANRLSLHPDPSWNDKEEVKDAKEAMVARLRAQAALQQSEVPDRNDIIDTIRACRRKEHARIYQLSRHAT